MSGGEIGVHQVATAPGAQPLGQMSDDAGCVLPGVKECVAHHYDITHSGLKPCVQPISVEDPGMGNSGDGTLRHSSRVDIRLNADGSALRSHDIGDEAEYDARSASNVGDAGPLGDSRLGPEGRLGLMCAGGHPFETDHLVGAEPKGI